MNAQPAAKMKQQTKHVVSDVAKTEQDKAIATVAIAFANDPMMRWSFPEPAMYFKVALRLIRAFGGNAFAHNSADQTGNLAAVALWLPPNVEPDHETMGEIFGMREQTPEQKKEGEDVFEQMGKFHPKEPHWYLPLIGTDPIHQGKGYGTALMEHAVRRCDRDRLPAYLESSSPANIPLYERFGFQVIGKIQSGASPVLTPMFRPAR
jgi:ribosomal protein S18 acetylase RimI-like enzyme